MIPAEKLERMLNVARMVATDVEADVEKWNGQPLTGKNVAAMHAELSACVQALAHIVDALVADLLADCTVEVAR